MHNNFVIKTTTPLLLQGGAEEAQQAHNLEVEGSNPSPAKLVLNEQ